MKKSIEKRCSHIGEALKYHKEDLKDQEKNKDKRLSYRTDFSRLMRYSPIGILYETKEGRIVRCGPCNKTWYTQAEYSEHLGKYK
jgi:hypothetical protein